MDQLSYLIKQAWASLQQRPGFVLTVVTTMGLTLGALLCVLTLAYLLLIEPLPYPDQDRLYSVDNLLIDQAQVSNFEAFTYPGLIHLYKNQDVFEQVAIVNYGQDVLRSLPNQPTLNTGYASPEWFELLDAPMQLGRRFEATEDLDTFNPVAIITYQTWQKEFAGRVDILDSKVSLGGVSYHIIGVLAKNFVEPQIQTTGLISDIWLPWDYNPDSGLKERWGNISLSINVVGKLKATLTPNQAEQIIMPLVNKRWLENVATMSFFKGWSTQMKLRPLKTVILGDKQHTLNLLIAGIVGVVLIAFANVVNLFMSRSAEQQRQMAIYAALGAKKSHLFKALLAETGLLMLMSILLALTMAVCGFYLLQTQLAAVLPRVNELQLNIFTFSAALILVVLFAMLFAYLSSKMINYRVLNSLLQSSGKGTGVQVSKRFRQTLIVSQVAIASVLFFANASLFSAAMSTITKPDDFTLDNMSHLIMTVSSTDAPSPDAVAADMTELKSKLLELPQVENISHSPSVLSFFGEWLVTAPVTEETFNIDSTFVSDNYFTLFGYSLLEGDYFSADDTKNRHWVMIVNDVFAKRLNPSGSVIGMQISGGGSENFTIVGVVKGIQKPGESTIPMRAYTPASLAYTEMTLKLKAGLTISREELVTAINSVSSQYALFSLDKLEDIKRQKLFTQYTTAITTAVLAVITLFLASVGLYGILSYGTQMRRFELGTRMAIGAKRSQLIGLIVKDNAWVIALGISTGIGVMLLLYIGFSDELSDYLGFDLILMFIVTLVTIGSISLFACYWPLRQYINKPVIHSLRGSD